MTTQNEWNPNSAQSLMTTELNSLANGSSAIASAAFDNSAGLWTHAWFELTVTYGTNPTAESLVSFYLLPSMDGTNYPSNTTGASPVQPSTGFIGGFPVKAVTTLQRIPMGGNGILIPIPPALFKAYLLNSVGQAMAASGNILKMMSFRIQSV